MITNETALMNITVPYTWLRILICQKLRTRRLLNRVRISRLNRENNPVTTRNAQNRYENKVIDSMKKLFSLAMITTFWAPARYHNSS